MYGWELIRVVCFLIVLFFLEWVEGICSVVFEFIIISGFGLLCGGGGDEEVKSFGYWL